MSFPFENLQVYKVALEWVENVENLNSTYENHLTRTFRDQFGRAALSIPLNIAEGNGRWHLSERKQFFWIARGSVFECVPLLEIVRRKKLVNKAQYEEYRDRLDHLGRMLTSLIKSLDG